MMIRMAILEDMFPKLDQLDGWISDPAKVEISGTLFGRAF